MGSLKNDKTDKIDKNELMNEAGVSFGGEEVCREVESVKAKKSHGLLLHEMHNQEDQVYIG